MAGRELGAWTTPRSDRQEQRRRGGRSSGPKRVRPTDDNFVDVVRRITRPRTYARRYIKYYQGNPLESVWCQVAGSPGRRVAVCVSLVLVPGLACAAWLFSLLLPSPLSQGKRKQINDLCVIVDTLPDVVDGAIQTLCLRNKTPNARLARTVT